MGAEQRGFESPQQHVDRRPAVREVGFGRTFVQVLTVSDEVVQQIYSPSAHQRFRDARLVLGCGDLRPSYLEFIVSTLNVPCLYVPGNHDARPEIAESGDLSAEPAGCISVDGRVVRTAGFSVAGLGGSPWYNGESHQYTDRAMWIRVLRLAPWIYWRQYRDGHRLDFLITHAAPLDIHDGPGAHRGFAAFRWLIDRFQPRFFIHGHVHPSYGYNKVTESVVGQTQVINTVGYRLLDVEQLHGLAVR
jgi:uncharacterized protein